MDISGGFNSSGFIPYYSDGDGGSNMISNPSMIEFEPVPISQGGRIQVVNAIDDLPQSLTQYCNDYLAVFTQVPQQSSFSGNNFIPTGNEQSEFGFQVDFEPEPIHNIIRDDSQNSSMDHSRCRYQSGTPPFNNHQPQQFSSGAAHQGNGLFIQQYPMKFGMDPTMIGMYSNDPSGANQVINMMSDI